MSIFNYPELPQAVIAILVDKLGGSITITQNDLNNISDAYAKEVKDLEGLHLTVEHSSKNQEH